MSTVKTPKLFSTASPFLDSLGSCVKSVISPSKFLKSTPNSLFLLFFPYLVFFLPYLVSFTIELIPCFSVILSLSENPQFCCVWSSSCA